MMDENGKHLLIGQKIIEDWKKALDENKYITTILMDLSKAFDCLPHDLILLNLEAYGL
jgi:hypothetical protein